MCKKPEKRPKLGIKVENGMKLKEKKIIHIPTAPHFFFLCQIFSDFVWVNWLNIIWKSDTFRLYTLTCMFVCVLCFHFDLTLFFLFFVCCCWFCSFVFCFVFVFVLSFSFVCFCICCVYPHYKWGHKKVIIICHPLWHVPRKAFLLSRPTHPAYDIYLHSIFTLGDVLVADICLLTNNSVNFSHQSITNHSKTKYWDTFVACRSETCAIRNMFQICIVCRSEKCGVIKQDRSEVGQIQFSFF